MRRVIGVVLAAGLSLGVAQAAPAAGSGARPSVVMQTFQDYCVKYGSRQIDVMTAADAAGFLPAPPAMTAQMMRSKDTSGMVRIRRLGDQTLVLATFATTGKDFMGSGGAADQTLVDVCVVSLTARAPTVPAEAEAWLGPAMGSAKEGYAFLQGPDGPLPVADTSDEGFMAAARAGTLRLMTIEDGPTSTALLLGAVRMPASLPADGAPAGPFADFKQICVDTKGAPDAVLAAAKGWMQAPADGGDLPYPMKSGEVRIKSTEDEFELLFSGVGHMQIGFKLLDMTYCAIAQAPPNDTLLMKSAEDWVGVPPVEIDPGGSRIYIFTDKGGVHTTLGSNLEAAIGKAMKAGPVYVAILVRSSSSGDHSVAAFGRLTKVADF